MKNLKKAALLLLLIPQIGIAMNVSDTVAEHLAEVAKGIRNVQGMEKLRKTIIKIKDNKKILQQQKLMAMEFFRNLQDGQAAINKNLLGNALQIKDKSKGNVVSSFFSYLTTPFSTAKDLISGWRGKGAAEKIAKTDLIDANKMLFRFSPPGFNAIDNMVRIDKTVEKGSESFFTTMKNKVNGAIKTGGDKMKDLLGSTKKLVKKHPYITAVIGIGSTYAAYKIYKRYRTKNPSKNSIILDAMNFSNQATIS
jgi:hypothetical protein